MLIAQESLNELVTRSDTISVEHPSEKLKAVDPRKPLLNEDATQESGEGHRRELLRTPSGIQRLPSDVHQEHVDKSSWLESCYDLGRLMHFRHFVGPNRQTSPRYDTVLWNLITLITFFSFLCLAARYPTKSVRAAFVSISGLVFLILLVSVGVDLASRGASKQRKTDLKYSSPKYQVIAHTSEILAILL